MTKPMSIYLDLVRFVAAMMVFHNHLAYERHGGGWLKPWGTFGNDAVMVFFVLSGFVIGYVASKSDATLESFAVRRTSRLWSVVLPALVVTVILDQIGSRIDPALYDGWWYAGDQPVWRFAANLFFVNQLWFENVRAFSNGPFWSIGYEFWYYVAFAAWFFVAPRWRWLSIGAVLAIMGPRLALLLPIWVLGVLVFRLCGRWTPNELLGWLLFVGSMAGFVAYRYFEVSDGLLDWTYATWGKESVRAFCAGYTERFLGDYVMGLLVALNFLGFHAVQGRLAAGLERFAPPIRLAAGYTFAIYLFHYPLLMFFNAMFGDDPMLLFPLTCIGILVCGEFSERRKDSYRRVVRGGVDWIKGLRG